MGNNEVVVDEWLEYIDPTGGVGNEKAVSELAIGMSFKVVGS